MLSGAFHGILQVLHIVLGFKLQNSIHSLTDDTGPTVCKTVSKLCKTPHQRHSSTVCMALFCGVVSSDNSDLLC